MNQGRFISRNARHFPDQPAIIFQDRVADFRTLEERSNRLANALLGLGLRKGDRVAFQMSNRPAIVELEVALYKAGLVRVPLNARLAPSEVVDVIENGEPRVFLVGDSHVESVQALRERLGQVEHFVGVGTPVPGWHDYEALLAAAGDTNPDVQMQAEDLAVLHYTSGSTGKLKAAMQTVGNRLSHLRKVGMHRMRVAPGDVLLLSGPLTHASGMFLQPFLYQGGAVLIQDKFDPDSLLAAVQRWRVTYTFMVPTMLNRLTTHPDLGRYDISSLKQIAYGGAPMAPARIREAWEKLGPVLSQGYGGGETTGGLILFSTQDHAGAVREKPARLASCGRPIGESEVRVVNEAGQLVRGDEVGEIVVRGPDVFAGYWKEPELTRQAFDADGWLHTGDLAKVDDEGFIYIVDRSKDMIISGGFNVYPTEVEQALYAHPAVYEACVVGVPDDTWGEAVKAVVVLRPGAQATEADIAQHCRDTLADFKKPRSVDFVAELPRNPNGKISRKAVREPFWAGQERRVG
ncbi:long-chain-fatty-acid--CoA ligase [Hydrogenophaga sp. BPS33]|uniref:long-chain-fatty-acid--CoA ligase n=1 Tax=Hydrogenophaga sp. BPS33 TaxID=2651974 RepID=UPI00131FFF9F|nr:long-chain-fatty-acid--CoA ligase [Hydrogenophaga sp. BPS33]QHE83923.1 long-chain fatty acid--CoA ligase [Hydrogenophaga sp. BPS33]